MIHGVKESLNLGDITKINTNNLPPDIDLITYGFPCQDISVAGHQNGFEKNGELTRSGLFFEALRIIKETKPRVAIAENVKNLTGKKFKDEFEIVLSSLDEAGYNNYWKVLNAKDYGIPQNRERVFIISIRKDIDNGKFQFPKETSLKLKAEDFLEKEVDKKYYLSNKMIDYILDLNDKQKGTKWQGNANNGVLNRNIIRTLSVRGAGGNQRAGVSNFIIDCYDGEVKASVLKNNAKYNHTNYHNEIRRLTPLECFRLMGFTDDDFNKISNISNAQLYQMAGNSIVVNVNTHLFNELFKSGILKLSVINDTNIKKDHIIAT